MIGSQPLMGSQPLPMLVPIASAGISLPPVMPTLPGTAAEAQLLANVELAEQRLREFDIMYDEQRRSLLGNEDAALNDYKRAVGSLPVRTVAPMHIGSNGVYP